MTQIDEVAKERHLKANFLEFLEAVARAVDKASPMDESDSDFDINDYKS